MLLWKSLYFSHLLLNYPPPPKIVIFKLDSVTMAACSADSWLSYKKIGDCKQSILTKLIYRSEISYQSSSISQNNHKFLCQWKMIEASGFSRVNYYFIQSNLMIAILILFHPPRSHRPQHWDLGNINSTFRQTKKNSWIYPCSVEFGWAIFHSISIFKSPLDH